MQVKWVHIVLGLWLVVSPFLLNITGAGRWSNIIVGIIIAVLAYTSSKQETGV
ncbi:MAG: SPW repeat protein [bacterium]|nr:SPW repeat protein [bacterium]